MVFGSSGFAASEHGALLDPQPVAVGQRCVSAHMGVVGAIAALPVRRSPAYRFVGLLLDARSRPRFAVDRPSSAPGR